jgi:3',5'-cyclic-AMP phosphodiesterase
MRVARVLQITDTHLCAIAGATLLGVDTEASLRAVLRQALGEHTPDAILATGDLVHDDASGASYQRFDRLVSEHFRGPVLHLAGNHDFIEPLTAHLRPAPQLSLGGWDIIAFDTHADARVEGAVDDAELRALESRIAASRAEHLLLACHHPLLPIGCPWLDRHHVPTGPEVLEACAADERVRGLVFGHVHQEVTARHGAVALLGTPSTCFQFEPGSRNFTIDRSPRSGLPGYRWLELGDDGTLRSAVRRLDDYTLNIDLSDGS